MSAHGNASLNPSVQCSDIHDGSYDPGLAMFSTLFKTFFEAKKAQTYSSVQLELWGSL